jgi:hypothetical protein
MARQHVLTRPDPPTFRAIIGEPAIRQLVGGRSVMQPQLERLLEAARSSIELRVLPYPAGDHYWFGGPFQLFTLRPPGQLTVAVLEQATQSQFLEQEEEVNTYREIFAHLLSATLDESSSLELIRQIVSQL